MICVLWELWLRLQNHLFCKSHICLLKYLEYCKFPLVLSVEDGFLWQFALWKHQIIAFYSLASETLVFRSMPSIFDALHSSRFHRGLRHALCFMLYVQRHKSQDGNIPEGDSRSEAQSPCYSSRELSWWMQFGDTAAQSWPIFKH